jgi:hypothetical protein
MTFTKLKISELKKSGWVKKLGIAGLLIFLIKGIVWIVIGLWIWFVAK